jgi:hypothetical protein
VEATVSHYVITYEFLPAPAADDDAVYVPLLAAVESLPGDCTWADAESAALSDMELEVDE